MDKPIIYFAKVKEDAIIPSKDLENAGYDIYANFKDEYLCILPQETVMINTGIASAFSNDYVMILKERGSTGTKGIAQRCGVIDSGFRNEWKVPVTNATNHAIIISKIPEDYYKKIDQEEFFIRSFGTNTVIYPYTKAISQALLFPVPKAELKEVTYDEIKAMESNRGMGMLGSTNK